MKAFRLTIAAALSIACAVACSGIEESVPEIAPESAPEIVPETSVDPQPIHLTVTAGLPGQTKTVITEEIVSGVPVFNTSWAVGDRCWVTEYMDDVDDGEEFSKELVESDALTTAGNPADFHFTLSNESGRPGHTYTYSYFASTVRNTRGYDSESNKEFFTFMIPRRQMIAPNTIDPDSDILISDVQVFNSRQTSLTFEFARVGTIVKMTIKGLREGDVIDSGLWSTGNNFYATNGLEDMNKYFPKEGRYKTEGGDKCVEFQRVSGYPIAADSNGEATIYLRTFSGVIDDWFSLELFVRRSGYKLEFFKYADLASASKTLQFNDGGVTMFSVSVLPEPGYFNRENYSTSLTTSWTAGDAVSVYNVTKDVALTGTLNAKDSGGYTQFEGAPEGNMEAGDVLLLSYLCPAYGSQDGTLAGIRSTCDYATAEALVAGLEGGQPVLSDGTFQNHQAIVKYAINQPVKELVISAGHLVGGPVTVTPASETNVLYVALSNTAGAAEDYTFVATRPDDSTVSTTMSFDYADGEYYEAALNFDIQVSSVSLDKTVLELPVGSSSTLTATVNPSNAADKSVSWNSSDETVATVVDGVVSAVAPGEADITVTTTDGGKTATCHVTVPTPSTDFNPVTTPFTIEAVEDGTAITVACGDGKTLRYSKDGGVNWIDVSTTSNTIELAAGETAILMGNTTITCNGTKITSNKDCYIYGNIMCLIYPDYDVRTEILVDSAFSGLFYSMSVSSDILMHIKNHPTKDIALPATTLTTSCYANMFRGTGIDRSPVLPATTLASGCYTRMFYNCASLTKVTCLAKDNMSSSCNAWLSGVASEGTFYKAAGATWSTGTIPTGWTVVEVQ
jgi:uncharacterized protein YjdB